MANRAWTQFQLSAVKGVVNIYPALLFTGASNPTLEHWNPNSGKYVAAPTGGTGGVLSCTRTSAGLFVLTLQDTYTRVLAAGITFMGSASAPAGPVFQVVVPSTPNTGFTSATVFNQLTLKFWGPTNSTTTTLIATDPAANEFGIIALQLQNVSAL